MKNKLLLPIMCFVLIISVSIGFSLIGCKEEAGGATETSTAGSESTEAVTEASETSSAEKTVLTFWTLQQADADVQSAQEAAVKDFEEKNNCDIQVTAFPYVELRDKMLAATASGQGPDILLLDQIWVAQYAAAGFVVPIDDKLSGSTIKKDDYFVGAWGAGSYLGKTYAIPFDVGVWALLYYNKDTFKEIGLDPEKPPVTWDEFLAVGKQLTQDNKYGTAIWVGAGDAVQCMTDAFTFSGGGKIVSDDGKTALFNSEAGVNALNFWKACDEISPPGTVGRGEEDAFQLFTAGQVAMFFYGEWGQDTIATRAPEMDYGVSFLPKPEGGESVGCFGGFNISINQTCKNKDLAWDFIVYSTSEEVEKEITMLTPAHAKAAEAYLKEKRQYPDIILEQLTKALFRPSVPNYPEIADVQRVATQEILLGKAGVKEALDAAVKEVNKLLNK